MPSATYDLFTVAMAARKQVLCIYEEHVREPCPFILGHNKAGEEAVLAFQFGGSSSGGLPRRGEWKCLRLAKVTNAELRDGPWHGGERHSQRQSCVAIVDYDVNPLSPYNPKHKLPGS
jgi:hypothetical protein